VKSNRPFRETFQQLLDMQDVSLRSVVQRGIERSETPKALSSVYAVHRGEAEPGIEMLEFIADCLRVEPETFAEYRMFKARCLFDPGTDIGFDGALRNLQALEQAAGGVDQPLPAGSLADRQAGRGKRSGRAASA
jgi:hypothetical protein